MPNMRIEKAYVTFPQEEVIWACQSMIAVSSIIVATSDEYANTGQLSIGALIHAGNVVDHIIDKLNLADLLIDVQDLPF